MTSARTLPAVAGEAQGEVVDHLAEPRVDLVECMQVTAAMTLDELDVESDILTDCWVHRGNAHCVLPGLSDLRPVLIDARRPRKVPEQLQYDEGSTD